MRKGCQQCGKGLPWNGGELVGARELCPRCAARARIAARAEREALEARGQGVMLAEEVPVVLPALEQSPQRWQCATCGREYEGKPACSWGRESVCDECADRATAEAGR